MLHILGGALLILFYKTCHPWRELGWEREAHCFGKLGKIGNQLTVETPYWCEDVSHKEKDIREEDSGEQENTKENVRQRNTKDPDVQDTHLVQAHYVQEHSVQGYSKDECCDQEHESRHQDGTQYEVVWKKDEERKDENILFNCHGEIDLLGQSRILVQVENILPNKEDEISRLWKIKTQTIYELESYLYQTQVRSIPELVRIICLNVWQDFLDVTPVCEDASGVPSLRSDLKWSPSPLK